MEKLKRYIIFLIGLFINSLGVSLITKANLGTSPISSIPYVLSLNFPFTLGQFTIAFSLLLILIQLIILRRNFKVEHLLQIPVSILFGYFIDLTMVMLFFVAPQSYISSMIYLLIGCLILGFGVYTEVLANVAMLPGESFVRAVSSTWKTEFGTTKVAFDVSLTVIAAVLSIVFARRLDGVREGTVIAALLVGFIARLFGRKLSFLDTLLFHSGESLQQSTFSAPAGNNAAPDIISGSADGNAGSSLRPVIVIGRQYGSGGHDIGKTLAERLGYAFYDNEIIQMTAGSTGYDPQFIRDREENMTNSFLYDLMSQMYVYSETQESPHDEIPIGSSTEIYLLFFSAAIPFFCSSNSAITSLVRITAFIHTRTSAAIRTANAHPNIFPSIPHPISMKRPTSSRIVTALNILRIFV